VGNPGATRSSTAPHRVVIAGGGVAAVEGLLALTSLARDRVEVTVVAPDNLFRYRPLSVAEPFSLTVPRGTHLVDMVEEQGARPVSAAITSVDATKKIVRTTDGQDLAYDSLLIAIGARGGVTIPGALAYWDSADRGAFRDVVDKLERGEIARVAFAVPPGVGWPLGLYELALLTADRLGDPGDKLTLVSPEVAPMGIFGPKAAAVVAGLLKDEGVKTSMGSTPTRFEAGELEIAGGPAIPCDAVVSLPIPEAPEIDGLPQNESGFVQVGSFCQVLGLEDVYAAGDVTDFPIKQGGLAAQGADSAASAIAAAAGARVEPQPFRPVLRGAILTRWGPRYLRSQAPGKVGSASKNVLWWPPAKIAGRFLAPYLAARAGYDIKASQLADLEPPAGEDAATPSPWHEDTVASILRSARANAAAGETSRALHYLEIAEDLAGFLPPRDEATRAELAHRRGDHRTG